MARRAPAASDNKFVDNIFPPDISSLCFDPYSNKMDPDVKEFTSQVKSWKRPSEWCKNPQLMKDDAAPGDIEQGQLGDCWLLSALGVVSVRPQLLKHLFVKVDPKRGEYRLRFYREGKWEEVTVDDRIPCGADGLPVYAHCVDPEEIWVPIIEKALAKMLGTYEALDGGYLEEGVVMLTGGRPEKVTVNNWKGKGVFEETSGDLWHKLNTYNREGHMMGAAICSGKEMPDNTTGLVAGHAYGVLNVAETSDRKFKLIKLRNPWGSFEWKGKWSDNAKEWTKQYITDMGHTNADDGTFWMELTDFRKYFDKITVCRIFNLRVLSLPSAVATEEDKALFGNTEWHRAKFECEWNDTNAGGILNDATYGQNPHLKVSFSDKGRAFFLISQPALTTQAESRYYRTGIGFALQKGLVDRKGMVRLPSQQPNAAQDENVFLQNPVRSRYNSAHLVVSPGQYVIVPFTDLPNRKTKFVFEVYAEKPFEASVLLPDDRAACRGVPPSARYNDGASVVPDMSRLNINSPKRVEAAVVSQRPPSVPQQVPAVARPVGATVNVQRPVVQQQQVMVKTAPPIRTKASSSTQKPAQPPSSSSSRKVSTTTTTTTTTSTQKSTPAPYATQKSAKPAAVQRSAPPPPKNDQFMTTSMMFYRK